VVARKGTRVVTMTSVAVAVAAALLALADPAQAKGALSATITGPGLDGPVELLGSGADPHLVTRLLEQSGLWYDTGDLPTRLGQRPTELGPGYTLTWVRFGSPGESVEQRTMHQIIYPAARGGPVIHTPTQQGLHGWGPEVIGWFEAPPGLLETLAQLGAPIAGASDLQSSSPRPPVAALSEHTPAGSVGYVWILAMVVTGLVLVVGARHLLRGNPALIDRRG
jgi:hypothetical protein